MACKSCNSNTCTCKDQFFKVEGCLVKCQPLKLVAYVFGEQGSVEVPADPTTLTILLEKPDGSQVRFYWDSSTSDGINRLKEGAFSADYFASIAGRYDVVIQTTGEFKAVNSHFFIEENGIDCSVDSSFELTETGDTFAAVGAPV